MTAHYDSGDVVTYTLNGVPPATSNPTVYVGMVIRAMTDAEIADVQDGDGVPLPLASPAFWVQQLVSGTISGPEGRTSGQPYVGVSIVESDNVLTVIKASGNGDPIAALLE